VFTKDLSRAHLGSAAGFAKQAPAISTPITMRRSEAPFAGMKKTPVWGVENSKAAIDQL